MNFKVLSPQNSWDQESYPRYQDLAVLPFFVVFFPMLRFVLDRFIFEKLAIRLMFGKNKDKLKASIKSKRINKFKESAWKTVYSLSAEILAILVIYNEPWFSNTRYFWAGPGDEIWPDQKMKFKLKLLYMYCGGFYIYAIFAVLFWDIRRSDFLASLAHHVGTAILIVLSYIFRFGRVGAVILALHEGSDVFLETAKMSKYSGLQKSKSSFGKQASAAFLEQLFEEYFVEWIVIKSEYCEYQFQLCGHLYLIRKGVTRTKKECADVNKRRDALSLKIDEATTHYLHPGFASLCEIFAGRSLSQFGGSKNNQPSSRDQKQGRLNSSGGGDPQRRVNRRRLNCVEPAVRGSHNIHTISWWILRMIYYPFWVLRSTSYEVHQILGKDGITTEETVLYFVFNSLLFGLLGLHLYWGSILVKMVSTLIRTGHVCDDDRSDCEDEEVHQNQHIYRLGSKLFTQ